MRVITILLMMLMAPVFCFGTETSESEYKSHFWTKQLVTPFTGDQATTYRKQYKTFKREMTTRTNYQLFIETAREVLEETGMCQFGQPVELSLQSCANNLPDEFATVTNMIRYYIDWSQGEQQTVLDLFKSQLGSPLLHERLEARLVLGCVKREMQTRDTMGAINECKSSAGWDLSEVMSVPCKDQMFSTQDRFDYDDFMTQCVLTDKVNQSKGADISKMVLPDFTIQLLTDSVEVKLAPPAVQPSVVYAALVKARKQEILSSWFLNLETQGCMSSVFAPSNFGSLEANERKAFYSTCLPTALVQKLGQLPAEDSKFYAELIARRLAILDMMEALNGAVMIATESYNIVNATDHEVGKLLEPIPAFSRALAKSYKDTIDLAMSSTFEDVIEAINETVAAYMTADAVREEVTDQLADDIRLLEYRTRTGAGR